MATILVDSDRITIPPSVVDHASFRRWFHSADFPETGRIGFFLGEPWVDMSKEQIFSHNQVKGEYGRVGGNLAKSSGRGRYFPDGMMLTNVEAGLSTVPDGAFVSFSTLKSGTVRLIEGAEEGYVELEGSPDMVLEVVSASSVEKDKEILMDLYWRAGITEYWLVDARAEHVEFDIYRHGPKGYRPVRKQGGWIKSQVFDKSFKLIVAQDQMDNPDYVLEVR